MAWIIIEETKIMAIRLNPVGEISLHDKNLSLAQSVRKRNFSSRKSWQRIKSTVGSRQFLVHLDFRERVRPTAVLLDAFAERAKGGRQFDSRGYFSDPSLLVGDDSRHWAI
jgi:hypothetical protein